MPVQEAVLALLAGGPCHGYELKARFEAAIGPQWGSMRIGHIYQVLDRLERDGLIAATERVAQPTRPDKQLFTLTPAGREELERYVTSAHVRQTGYRDELFLKIFAATRVGEQALATFLSAQRQVYLTELAELAALRGTHLTDPLVELLLDAAIRHTQADLAVLDAAEERLPELSAPLDRIADGKRGAVSEQVAPRRTAAS